jgi:hypothetical protein
MVDYRLLCKLRARIHHLPAIIASETLEQSATDCLNYLLSNERSSEVVCRLRQSNLLRGVICQLIAILNRFYRML